ncbi:MAG: hypothetical protein OXH92_13810 [Bryobacterales bacterium]|nr:hypothetical protein [Bryobacterales bacterium]
MPGRAETSAYRDPKHPAPCGMHPKKRWNRIVRGHVECSRSRLGTDPILQPDSTPGTAHAKKRTENILPHHRAQQPVAIATQAALRAPGPIAYCPACISHHPTAEARHTAARTSLRLLAVLNVLFKYACARQAARAFFLRPACASSWRPSHALRLATW